MFEQGLVRNSASRQGWTFVASITIQVVGTAILVAFPLLNTYEIDLGAWARTALTLAAPPPPAPPPPQARPAPAPRVQRFEADFQAPAVIPDKVAFLHDAGEAVSGIAALPMSPGLPGGTGDPGIAGVLGMFAADTDTVPLPPPVRVGGRVQNARITRRVLPVYPPEAVEQQITGTVRLEAIIGVDGLVRDLKLVEGHPLLAPAAVEAVSQWEYRPTTLNGLDVEVLTLIEVNFTLTIVDEKEYKRQQRRLQRQGRAR